MAELDKKGLEAAAKALHADIEESLGAADWQSAGISYKEARLHDAETAIRAYLAALLPRPVEVGVPEDARVAELEEVLGDLLSWFDKPSEPEWRIKAGPYGADDAVEAARTALEGRKQ